MWKAPFWEPWSPPSEAESLAACFACTFPAHAESCSGQINRSIAVGFCLAEKASSSCDSARHVLPDVLSRSLHLIPALLSSLTLFVQLGGKVDFLLAGA